MCENKQNSRDWMEQNEHGAHVPKLKNPIHRELSLIDLSVSTPEMLHS